MHMHAFLNPSTDLLSFDLKIRRIRRWITKPTETPLRRWRHQRFLFFHCCSKVCWSWAACSRSSDASNNVFLLQTSPLFMRETRHFMTTLSILKSWWVFKSDLYYFNGEKKLFINEACPSLYPAYDSRCGAIPPPVSERSHGSVHKFLLLFQFDIQSVIVWHKSVLWVIQKFPSPPGNGIIQKSSSEARAYIDYLHVIDNQQTLFELSHRLEPRT